MMQSEARGQVAMAYCEVAESMWNTSAAYMESRVLYFERFLQISDAIASAGSRDRYRRIQELCALAVQFGDACLNDLVRSVLLAYRQSLGPGTLVAKLHGMNEYCRNNRAYYQMQLARCHTSQLESRQL